MTKVEHDVGGTVVHSNIQDVVSSFRSAGFEIDEPRGGEYSLSNESIELQLSPYFAAESDTSAFLLTGELECEPRNLRTRLEILAELLGKAGARYLLEAELVDAVGAIVLQHPAFEHPRPARLTGTFSFSVGNPLRPFGQDRITVEPRGTFVYERTEGTEITNKATGSFSQATVGGLATELTASKFPRVSDHEIFPGSGNLVIAKGNEKAMVSMTGGRNFVGYGHIIQMVRDWFAYLACATPTVAVPFGMAVLSKETQSRFGFDP